MAMEVRGMTLVGIFMAITMLFGVGAPDNYPPEPPKGTNGPSQPHG